MSMLDVLRPPPTPQPIELEHLSWSAISTYRSCPLKWHFRHVQRLPEEFVSAGLVFGSAIHAALEHHYREHLAGSRAELDELLDVYQQAWHEDRGEVRFGLREDRASLEQLARRMLAAFLASEHAQLDGTVLGVEEQLQGPLVVGCPEILARVDLVTLEGAAVVVTDFKTSGSRWSDEQREQQGEQLVLYSELARELLPGRELRLRFLVLTKSREPAIEQHDVALDASRSARLRAVLRRVWQSMQTGVVYPAPSPLQCPSCPYRRACRAWPGGAA